MVCSHEVLKKLKEITIATIDRKLRHEKEVLFRQVIGYLRYDTEEKMDLINDIYRNELRLFKNFFSTSDKDREEGKDKRKDSSKVRRSQDALSPNNGV
ncbi:MAG: hypothetical protein GYA00_02660 [Parcubacteria group bacterium]|jgi:hypothetical protein|nr:hypothetical protein [Parcubacteria group bacterium]